MLLIGLSLLLPIGLLLQYYLFALCIQSLYRGFPCVDVYIFGSVIHALYLYPVYDIVKANLDCCCLHE